MRAAQQSEASPSWRLTRDAVNAARNEYATWRDGKQLYGGSKPYSALRLQAKKSAPTTWAGRGPRVGYRRNPTYETVTIVRYASTVRRRSSYPRTTNTGRNENTH